MHNYLFLFLVFGLFSSCGETTNNNNVDKVNDATEVAKQVDNSSANQFWQSLTSLDGKTFEGKLVKAPENNDFEGKKMVMHVLYSDDEKILIPFNVGENLSRTWIFERQQDKIQLKHDHRKPNGESDEITMYGGVSTNQGLPSMQIFPADQETFSLLPGAFSNVWWVKIDDTKFSYNLSRIGAGTLFTIEFDLTNEIEKPTPSWGWEDFQKEQ